ncbi:MAG: hypothetical protein JO262_18165 [Solirubrobacterales bacterium]|nr:hypothetical protein [Solirubrobacterales bacterium]MBV9944059.1 hypothetical protein [Solirubrobacterales bacterium]
MSASATIRGAMADGADGERIDRLAALAGSHAPESPMLIAEVEGHPVAAIGIFDGHAISDPYRSTPALRLRLWLLRLELRLTVAVHGI